MCSHKQSLTGMPSSSPENLLRLGKKYEPRSRDIDVPALLAEQSLRGAVLGACLGAVILMALWVWLYLMFDRFFPWFSVVQGFFIGRAARHFGRGIDWYFPAIVAAIAVVAAFLGSFVSALFLTGREFDTPAWSLISEISWHTISTFATQQFGVVGSIYAGMAAAAAGFFANRRLDRYQAVALRKYRDGARQ